MGRAGSGSTRFCRGRRPTCWGISVLRDKVSIIVVMLPKASPAKTTGEFGRVHGQGGVKVDPVLLVVGRKSGQGHGRPGPKP
jgi:hypothetical protein